MATLEHEVTHEAAHEVTREIGIRLSREQAERLERAALATGQSLAGFAASALLRAAEDALNHSSPATPPIDSDPLDRVAGIFKDEPLMDALMERIREDRRREIGAGA